MLFSGIIAVRKKQPSAYFFLIAWSALIVGLFLYLFLKFFKNKIHLQVRLSLGPIEIFLQSKFYTMND